MIPTKVASTRNPRPPRLKRRACQVSKSGTEHYSLPANLALLRLYVTQPEKANPQLLSKVLVKAMMRLPNTDFATMLHLVPERLQVTILPGIRHSAA